MESSKPKDFENVLGSYRVVLYDGYCGEAVAWGFEIKTYLGEERFNDLRKFGLLECLEPGKWALITRTLSRAEAATKYGKITEEVRGSKGGWKSTTFGEKKFISRFLRPEKS